MGMSGVFQAFLLVGDLIFLFLIFLFVKHGKLSVRFSLMWFGLGGALLIFALFPYVAKILRSILQIEVVSNLIFMLLFCFVLLLLLLLSSAASEHTERLKRLTQQNALLEKRVRHLEEQLAAHTPRE